ncbi:MULTISPECIES: GntR family transcriptional regulator [unclassified Sphingobium]|uniref:GntR family transcriptional regulator n=1 Tax=unclassified Sphingobium TaxID=2611147 RepID=UPI000D1605BB|nr:MULTISPECIES: GntR family transcriptional regulator [unclassified Sphingobium]MBG6120189.1 GntR family transcriptional regulator of vanillate catabolism [Sphingobium sp. JAI105]PSO09854.1 GntR family transcriptional regulator [Sphingobium sp. AEW4]TWD00153.1 GntR family transcriptional regulator [Sphingobium sp. AEW010]TWD19212.1 GntR family transcriptional regulator [Sphingobium sp. AEW013]TWD22123.1 GntR family transcriptional regulator [Sphingobium sp. AEW001]
MSTRVEAVTLQLREMIVNRQLPSGSRVPERDIAAALGVSRTPVRVALGILEAEGLVRGEPNKGFVVNEFSVEDVLSGFDVRGALEGLAVRTAVEGGISEDTLATLQRCVDEGDQLVATGLCNVEDMRRWSVANGEFHRAIIEAAGLRALESVHAFMGRMPLVAPIAILFTSDKHDDAYARMVDAHSDHVHILTAIKAREASRAEYLMREHAHRSRDHLARLLKSAATPEAPAPKRRRLRKHKNDVE